MEGDPHSEGAFELDADKLVACVAIAYRIGVRKIKLLGGEPLLRRDLESLIQRIRESAPDADLSMITAGLAPPSRVRSVLDAGLDRINLTFHGFEPKAFSERVRSAGAWKRRQDFVTAALATGRPIKCNYVFRGESDLVDLAALLEWAKSTHAVIGLLDELQSDMGYAGVASALKSLRGEPAQVIEVGDEHSLPTEQWRWNDGLKVELKNHRLGEIAPYEACRTCPVRRRCAEGIFALRLTHTGAIAPCMDRPQLAFSLIDAIEAFGPTSAEMLLRSVIRSGFASSETASQPAPASIWARKTGTYE
jgi:cyclic pyranopterin phosphate synthase